MPIRPEDKRLAEIHRTFLTGTSASVLLGVNPYKDLQTLWEEMAGLRTNVEEDNPHMDRGRRLEAVALDLFEEFGGGAVKLNRSPPFLKSVRHPRWGCHIDATFSDTGNLTADANPGVMDAKAPGREMLKKIQLNGIPGYWQAQLHWNGGILNESVRKKDGLLLTLGILQWDPWGIKVVDVPWDPEIQKELERRGRVFMDCVIKRIPPPQWDPYPFPKLGADHAIPWPEVEAKLREIHEALGAVQEVLKEFSDTERALKERLKETLRDAGLSGQKVMLLNGDTDPGPDRSETAKQAVVISLTPQVRRSLDEKRLGGVLQNMVAIRDIFLEAGLIREDGVGPGASLDPDQVANIARILADLPDNAILDDFKTKFSVTEVLRITVQSLRPKSQPEVLPEAAAEAKRDAPTAHQNKAGLHDPFAVAPSHATDSNRPYREIIETMNLPAPPGRDTAAAQIDVDSLPLPPRGDAAATPSRLPEPQDLPPPPKAPVRSLPASPDHPIW